MVEKGEEAAFNVRPVTGGERWGRRNGEGRTVGLQEIGRRGEGGSWYR